MSGRATLRAMQKFDLAVIGAGAAGEAAAQYAAGQGASVAIIDRGLFGGSCPFFACMPSKALLHAAAVHHAGGDFPWARASDFRDYMINREGIDTPDDSGHTRSLESAGATVIRGSASLAGPRQVRIGDQLLSADAVVLAIGSVSRVPHDLPGLDEAQPWTNVEGTGTRELPRSLVVLGAGPTGIELSQVYARYGVPVTLVHPRDRVHDREHRRSSEYLGAALEKEGVRLRLGTRATSVDAAPRGGAHRIELDSGDTVEGHEILLAIGRELPLDGLGLDTVGVTPTNGKLEPDDRLQIADGIYVAGDVAGPELHTHLGHYTGEAAARIALGDADYRPFLDAIPRATYTDPEIASVGLLREQARERGIDAAEFTIDIATSSKGYTTETGGHCTIVVDRRERVLVGAFIAGLAASEVIHECVLAIRARVPLATLADTLHAFPTVARVLGTAFIEADRALPR
jgi:pyruvate/2-oxoglutarate dehydrogenase complex dihydrolipoamide dehydrogenase (E3) component